MKAMIFAAGLGTRLRPLTDTIPKALVPVGGEPLLGRLVGKLKSAGYGDITVNVHHFAEKIEEYIRTNGNFGVGISISDERDLLRDTGGGLLHARKFLENDNGFLVHNVDILSNLDFSLLDDTGGDFAALVVSDRKSSRYLLFDNDMRLVGWKNAVTGEIRTPYMKLPEYRALAFSGIHKISGAVFPELEKYAGAHGPVFSIIDFYLSICDRLPIRGLVPPGFRMIDVGKLSSLPAAEAFSRAF